MLGELDKELLFNRRIGYWTAIPLAYSSICCCCFRRVLQSDLHIRDKRLINDCRGVSTRILVVRFMNQEDIHSVKRMRKPIFDIFIRSLVRQT